MSCHNQNNFNREEQEIIDQCVNRLNEDVIVNVINKQTKSGKNDK